MVAASSSVPAARGPVAYGTYVDEVLGYRQTVGGVASVYYPHGNHLYSVAALTNAAGQVVERYSYTAYGKQSITGPTGVVRQVSAVGFDRGFTGYVTDVETGLLHARARMYSPGLGRFVSRDPVGYVDGLSLYRAYFTPNGKDPLGLVLKVDGDKAYLDKTEKVLQKLVDPTGTLGLKVKVDRPFGFVQIIPKPKPPMPKGAEIVQKLIDDDDWHRIADGENPKYKNAGGGFPGARGWTWVQPETWYNVGSGGDYSVALTDYDWDQTGSKMEVVDPVTGDPVVQVIPDPLEKDAAALGHELSHGTGTTGQDTVNDENEVRDSMGCPKRTGTDHR